MQFQTIPTPRQIAVVSILLLVATAIFWITPVQAAELEVPESITPCASTIPTDWYQNLSSTVQATVTNTDYFFVISQSGNSSIRFSYVKKSSHPNARITLAANNKWNITGLTTFTGQYGGMLYDQSVYSNLNTSDSSTTFPVGECVHTIKNYDHAIETPYSGDTGNLLIQTALPESTATELATEPMKTAGEPATYTYTYESVEPEPGTTPTTDYVALTQIIAAGLSIGIIIILLKPFAVRFPR